MERVTGIEPVLFAWEAKVLPLNYTRSAPEGIDAFFPRRELYIIPAGFDLQTYLATGHQMEVSTLSCGAAHPYPLHYRETLAFSIILYPLRHQTTLRLPLSAKQARRRIGLTAFRISNRIGKVPPFRR